MSDEIENAPRFCQMIDGFIRRIGQAIAWLNVLLIINILAQVILRYAFGKGMIWLEELQWHFYGVCIMFGISYGIVTNAHIRLDLLHNKFTPKKKEAVEFFGILFLLLPLVIILFVHGLDFVESAWRVSERSESPLGLPWRWLIKSVVPISMFFLILASVSRMIRSVAIIFQKNGHKDKA